MLIDPVLRPRIPHEIVMVIGGWSSGSVTNAIELYDPRANVWLNCNYCDESKWQLLFNYFYSITVTMSS